MIITNSLGSNYTPDFLKLVSQIHPSTKTNPDQQKLLTTLNLLYSGKTILFYKARHAISAALKHFGVGEGDIVFTQAFTCYAVEQAITAVNAQPHFVDLAPNSLNLSLNTLKHALEQSSVPPKALIIQHTLGYPVSDIHLIKSWCQRHHIYLIEDLAHAAGATYHQGNFTGHYSDAVVLSFGRDKILDAISGGALIIKTKIKSASSNPPPPRPDPIPTQQLSLLLQYPKLTASIRSNHPLVGKLLHRFYLLTGRITSPIADPSPLFSPLPAAFNPLALYSIEHLTQNITHRRQITNLYHKQLAQPSTLIQHSHISTSTCLRYPLRVINRHRLIKHLKQHNYHLGDIWYNQPVATGRLQVSSTYSPKSCPQAETLSASIINLPTHANINSDQAQTLVQLINQFTK